MYDFQIHVLEPYFQNQILRMKKIYILVWVCVNIYGEMYGSGGRDVTTCKNLYGLSVKKAS